MEDSTEKENVLTDDDLMIIAKNHFKTPGSLELIDYEIKIHDKEQAKGFAGSYSSLIMKVKYNGNIEKLQFFMKSIPNAGRQIVANQLRENKVFEKEAKFYSEIAPKLRESCKSDKWAADFYIVKENLMVLEDLKYSGYSHKDYPLSVDDLRCALSTFAHFHASSILLEAKAQMPLDKIFDPSLLSEGVYDKNIEGLGRMWFCSAINVALAIAKYFKLENADAVPSLMERVYDVVKRNDKYINAINHGDLWTNNFMFNDKNCVLIDFQTYSYRPMALDLCLFMYVNTEREFLKKFELEMLRHYHSELSKTIKLSDEFVAPPDFNKILSNYEDLRIFGKIISVAYLCTILSSKQKVTEFNQDEGNEAFEKFLSNSEENKQVALEYVETDEAFKHKIKEAIADLLEEVKFLN